MLQFCDVIPKAFKLPRSFLKRGKLQTSLITGDGCDVCISGDNTCIYYRTNRMCNNKEFTPPFKLIAVRYEEDPVDCDIYYYVLAENGCEYEFDFDYLSVSCSGIGVPVKSLTSYLC